MREVLATGRPRRTLAILFPSTGYGGAEHYVRVIARAATTQGWRVHAAFPELEATQRLRHDLGADGVTCHTHSPRRILGLRVSPWSALRLLLSEAVSTFRLLASIRPDSVLVMLPHPLQFDGAVLAATVTSRRRAVIVCQLVGDSLTVSGMHRLVYTAARLLGGRWTCVSRANQRQLAGSLRWSADAIGVIPNGVSTRGAGERVSSEATRAARDALLRECAIPPEAVLLLTAGRLTSQKAHDVIARSVPRVVATAAHAHWIWAGDGPAHGELVRLLAELGVADRVHLLGFRDDMRPLLSAADLFVLPSRAEGQAFALLEAAAAELPVIASVIPPVREAFRDRETGLLVPVDDPTALADATVWAIEHPTEMKMMATRARLIVEREYSAERMVQQTLELLDTP